MENKGEEIVKEAEHPPAWKFWAKKPKSEHEANDKNLRSLPYLQLFKYSTFNVRVNLFISLICAAGHGTMLPILILVFGGVTDEIARTFLPLGDPNHLPNSELSSAIDSQTRLFLILAFVAWIVSSLQLFFALRAANLLGNIIRAKFFKALLRQPPPFYDSNAPGSLTQLVISDISLIQAGVGDKLSTAVQFLTTFFTGLFVGFFKGWQLTLVILAVTPILLLSGFAFGQASADATGDSLGSYGDAGAAASESLSLIRTVTTFSSQNSESQRYEKALRKGYTASVRSALLSGAGLGTAMFCILCTYGLGLWFGSLKIDSGEMSPGDVMITFFALSLGASSLGTAGPAFKSFSKSRAAAPRVFNIIDTISDIDPMDDDTGDIIPDAKLKGRITFEKINFTYPNRRIDDAEEAEDKNEGKDGKSDLVLKNFSLDIEAGTSEALVGKSGCGKSTLARMIQRLYDPINGSVKLDGVDIRTLNVRWFRSRIGVVQQTPSLFMLSIRENIALGAGVVFSRDSGETVVTPQEVTQEDIVSAAKLANAHDFISKLPNGYDTVVGERGATLSGGQKQRVCIARALVRNPAILVLDESTASLDTESERIVQKALEKASEGRTTVTIAHRLSTVRHADNISCVQDGHVTERGAHDNLLKLEGGYYKGLFDLQNFEREKLNEDKEDDHSFSQRTTIVDAHGKNSTTHADSITNKLGIETEDKKEGPDIDKGVFLRTLKLNAKEWPLLLLGSVGAIGSGIVWPLTSIGLVQMINILSEPDIDKSDVRFWALSFVVLATVALLGNFMQHGILGISGENLTFRLRSATFRHMLRQEMGYFDAHPTGVLSTLLASDTVAIKGLTGDLMGVGINVLSSLTAGLIIAFISCWRIALIVLAVFPGVALGGYFEMQASAGIDSGARSEFVAANTVAAEAVDNISTVRAMGREEYFHDRFSKLISSTNVRKGRKDAITGFAYGFSEFCQFLIWYATFKAGGDFMQQNLCTFREFLQASMALLFAAITLGNVSIFAPDVSASRMAATQVYRLLDRKSEIDPGESEDDRLSNIKGVVKADDVFFEYPTRNDTPVLRGLSLQANGGETVAIVGKSGHGKSTIIALLQRFYTARAGSVTLDNVDVTLPTPSSIRSHTGVVSQEPELFNRSVFDNIAYGLLEGTPATTELIERAAKLAFAHDFIKALPQGYDTVVGERGDALSGGQKQRVAIARSVIREPKVLLLDEATSALDGASERGVQKALDEARKGRTTLVVAHRLSTIKGADRIVVVKRGRIVESGRHEELLKVNGVYAKLVENQLTEI